MKLLNLVWQKISSFFMLLYHSSLKIKILVLLLVGAALYFSYPYVTKLQSKKITYQTTKAALNTLTTTVSGTGTISSGNSTNITTAATGTVKEVYVTNGEKVTKGQKIAEITLDDYGIEQQASAWANYNDLLTAVKSAQQEKEDEDLAMWNAKKEITEAEDAQDYKNKNPINPDTKENYTDTEKTIIDKKVITAHAAYSTAEDKYIKADATIAKAQAKVTAALRDYQEVSSIITAPIDGVVNNLSLSSGIILSSTSTSKTATSTNSTQNDTSSTITSQTLGKIYNTDGQLQASVSLSESDVINVLPNQKVTLTLDAYTDKTFTGKVLAVDTTGSVSSGVTTYPVTILLDKTSISIYPNMSLSATIITSVKTDVLSIPSTTITTSGSTSTVQVLKNNKPVTVTITTGSSDDTQTEVKSGLSIGDAVITNITDSSSASENNTTSPFSTTTKRSSSKNSSSMQGGGMPGAGGPPGM